MTDSRATVVDLFSGAGGISLGFHAAGARLLAAVDAREEAGITLEQNFRSLQPEAPPLVLHGEAGNLETLDLERIARRHRGPDILVGGPPCQGFSRVGRGKIRSLFGEDAASSDPRNQLYRRFVHAAEFWKPRVVLMENVIGMLSVQQENVADLVAADLASCGYRVGYALLNAVWFGVPQFRERLFFIGLREDLGLPPSAPALTHMAGMPSGYLRPREGTMAFDFADKFELPLATGRIAHQATTAGEALDDLPPIQDHLLPGMKKTSTAQLHEIKPYDRPAHSAYAHLMREWPGFEPPAGVPEHHIRLTHRDFETFRRMKPLDRYQQAVEIARTRLAEELVRLRAEGRAPAENSPEYRQLEKMFVPPYPEDQFKDKWRKLSPAHPSWTLPAHLSKDSYSHIHHDSSQARAISVREAARLQSFPDAFRFHGNMGDCFTQIGNAVPPVLAWAIASHLLQKIGAPSHGCPLALAPASER